MTRFALVAIFASFAMSASVATAADDLSGDPEKDPQIQCDNACVDKYPPGKDRNACQEKCLDDWLSGGDQKKN